MLDEYDPDREPRLPVKMTRIEAILLTVLIVGIIYLVVHHQ